MKKRLRIFDLVVAVAVIAALSLMVNNHLNSRYASLAAQAKILDEEQRNLDRIMSSLQTELGRADSNAYIVQVAREDYGYLMPGEILFKVSNIDDLYAVHEVTLEEAP